MPEYSLDPLQDDCYENSTVLKNKFNIRDAEQLDIMEQSVTSMLIAKAAIEIPFENVDFDFYKNLHKYIFADIYDWAGTVRTVDMSKKGTNFCPADKINERGQRIFQRLSKLNFLKDIKGDDFIVEFTDLYCDLNYLHPFREGNGRTQRLFLSMLVSNLGMSLDFAQIDADYLMIATIKSVNGDIFMLRDIFREYIK
ncbi:MAG: cell filamentation protein Fic [Clostridia bacterium]|nr:cell filamentation protein Fic [Clostridia bacterium]